jgi:hypothetical protein
MYEEIELLFNHGIEEHAQFNYSQSLRTNQPRTEPSKKSRRQCCIQLVPESKSIRMGKFSRPSMNAIPLKSKTNVKRMKTTEDTERLFCRELTTSVKKTKPLTMHDYKKFKQVTSIESKYKIGKTLGSGAFG